MSVQQEAQPFAEPQGDELQRHLELVVSNEYPELPRPQAHSNMANGDLCTWSTMPERDHKYNGVLSYADPLSDGSPRYFVSEIAYQAYRAAKHK